MISERVGGEGGDWKVGKLLLEALGIMGGPALSPTMQRSRIRRSSGPLAGRCKASARRRAASCAAGVKAGKRPFGGSTISDVRRLGTTLVQRSHQASVEARVLAASA